MSFKILGVDPGGTTGIVVCDVVPDEPLELIDAVEIEGFNDQVDYLEGWITEARDDALVICERFISRATKFAADAPSACEPIGVIKYLCRVHDVGLQLPVPAMRSGITDDALRRGGYYIRGQEHSRQAMKHVLKVVTSDLRHMPTLEALHPRD